jgi:hypothetical protein
MSPPFLGGVIMISTAYVISDSSQGLPIDHLRQCNMVRWVGRVEWSYAVELSDQEI